MIDSPLQFVPQCVAMHQRCTRAEHPHPIPIWFRYSEEKESEYQRRLRVLTRRHGDQASTMMREEMNSHLNGFYDSSGNFFCGFCGIWPTWFMDYGRLLDYPDLHQFDACVQSRNVIGYEGYLNAVTRASVVRIEDAVRAMKWAMSRREK